MENRSAEEYPRASPYKHKFTETEKINKKK